MRRLLLSFLFFFSSYLYASSDIYLIPSKFSHKNVSLEKINKVVQDNFNLNEYRDVKVQVIYDNKQNMNYLLVFLPSKTSHSLTVSRVNIDSHYQVLSIENKYHVTAEEAAQQGGIAVNQAKCPNNSVAVIAFAPNNHKLELAVTRDVALAAIIHGLKTVTLLTKNATRDNYLNYMTCPNLKGNFYDGDADPELIITVDGYIYADDFKQILAKKFRFKVTNIWLACQAFNDPMRSAVIDVAETQKYAAGINNLLIGPSDFAAACAMKKAFDGKPMEAAFWDCYKKFDRDKDIWGYGGRGADYFGV